MLIKLNDLSSVRKEVEVEIPADAVESELRSVTTEFAQHAKIAGFRPGKVPIQVVRTRFRSEIEKEVVDRLVPRLFHEVLHERGLEPVGSPGLKSRDPLEPGKPIRFVAEFETKPPIELRDYLGVKIDEPPIEVTEEDLDEVIDRMREQSSTFESVTDRPAAEGDLVTIDVVSAAAGDGEPRRTENYQVRLDNEAPLPELRDALIGAAVGETRTFDKTYEEDAPNEEVRGKTVRYELTLKEVRLQQKPDVDDAFARSTGFGETVAELRDRVAADLRRHKEHQALQAKRQQAADKLVEMHPIDAPESLVQEEVSKSLRNYARFLASQGVDLEKAEIDWAKVRDDFLPEAERRVKRELILEAIGRKEGLTVSETEVDAEIRRAATGTKREFAEVKHRLRDDGGYEALRNSILQEKALEHVLLHCVKN